MPSLEPCFPYDPVQAAGRSEASLSPTVASTAIYGYANKTPIYDASQGGEGNTNTNTARGRDARNKERPSPPPFSVSSCDDQNNSGAKKDVPVAPAVPAARLLAGERKAKVRRRKTPAWLHSIDRLGCVYLSIYASENVHGGRVL